MVREKHSLAYIRRAVEGADLNAVRVALFHNTGDAELADLPVAAKLDDAQRRLLIDKAVAWLAENAGPGELTEPPPVELRRLMNMVTGGEMGDLEFEARREITGFRPYPFAASWTGEKPPVPKGL